MYPTILVPLDDSDQSRRVLPYASRLAAAGHGRLVLMQTILHPELRRYAEAELSRIAEELAHQLVQVETIVQEGDAERHIVDLADQLGPDLIAMATDRSTDLDRWFNGSVVDWVLRHTSAPLLVASPNCAPAWQAHEAPEILVPLDGSHLAEEALRPAVALAKLLDSEVLLLRVADGGRAPVAAAEAYVDVVSAELTRQQLRVGSRVVVGDAASAIAQAASGLIVMATHGRSGLARLIIGSVATRVLQRANVPVVLLRPTALSPAASPGRAAQLPVRRLH